VLIRFRGFFFIESLPSNGCLRQTSYHIIKEAGRDDVGWIQLTQDIGQ
jgi:hypothetical protein